MKKILLVFVVFVVVGFVNVVEILKLDVGIVDFYGQLCIELKFLEDKDLIIGFGFLCVGVDVNYIVNDSLVL